MLTGDDCEHPAHDAVAPTPGSVEHLRFALGVAHMGVFEWNLVSDAVIWAKTTGMGFSVDDAPTSGREFFECVHPDDRTALKNACDQAIRDRSEVVTEFRTISPDGAIHWIQGHGRVLYNPAGTPQRIMGVNSDITHRKELEAQHRQGLDQLEPLSVLKSTMRTVQDIVGNALMGLYFFRMEAEAHVSAESLKLFDFIIAETKEKLTSIANLERVVQTQMCTGTGIEYEGRSPLAEQPWREGIDPDRRR